MSTEVQIDEVERRVVVREDDTSSRGLRAVGVVAAVVQVGDLEAEVRVGGVALAAPRDAVAVDVEAVVGAPGREVSGQRPGHPADAAADVEHALVAAERGEVAKWPRNSSPVSTKSEWPTKSSRRGGTRRSLRPPRRSRRSSARRRSDVRARSRRGSGTALDPSCRRACAYPGVAGRREWLTLATADSARAGRPRRDASWRRHSVMSTSARSAKRDFGRHDPWKSS